MHAANQYCKLRKILSHAALYLAFRSHAAFDAAVAYKAAAFISNNRAQLKLKTVRALAPLVGQTPLY